MTVTLVPSPRELRWEPRFERTGTAERLGREPAEQLRNRFVA
jgi:hypothetical protein